jgi:hypothetical protein
MKIFTPYSPKIIRDPWPIEEGVWTLPEGTHEEIPLHSFIAIGSAGPDKTTDSGVWQRLVDSNRKIQEKTYRIYLSGEKSFAQRNLLALHAPSQLERVRILEPKSASWNLLVDNGRAFAAVFANRTCCYAIVGPPTEDAWEEFEFNALKLIG